MNLRSIAATALAAGTLAIIPASSGPVTTQAASPYTGGATIGGTFTARFTFLSQNTILTITIPNQTIDFGAMSPLRVAADASWSWDGAQTTGTLLLQSPIFEPGNNMTVDVGVPAFPGEFPLGDGIQLDSIAFADPASSFSYDSADSDYVLTPPSDAIALSSGGGTVVNVTSTFTLTIST